MTRRSGIVRWLTAMAVLAMFAGGAWAGRPEVAYTSVKKTVRACILVTQSNSAAADLLELDESVFYLLDQDVISVNGVTYDTPKPAGWEFINPLAPAGIAKSDPGYWRVWLTGAVVPELANFDVILLPVRNAVPFADEERDNLRRIVEMGGTLWLDCDRPQNASPFLQNFFLHPALDFIGGMRKGASRAVKQPVEIVDPGTGQVLLTTANHPLLRGEFRLTEGEINWLGQQLTYNTDATGASYFDGIDPLSLGTGACLQEVVRGIKTAGPDTQAYLPMIAAGAYGNGFIVVTSCDVGDGINNWYRDQTVGPPGGGGPIPPGQTEVPAWVWPDFKFVYNMVRWSFSWTTGHRNPGHTGFYPEAVRPPLYASWAYTLGAGVGSPVVDRGAVLVGDGGGYLRAFDTKPSEVRALSGSTDDGVVDYALGPAYDMLWSTALPLPATGAAAVAVGSPTCATIFDSVQSISRELAITAYRNFNAGGNPIEGRLAAFYADPSDAQQGMALWATDITADSSQLRSSPVTDQGLTFVTTTGSPATNTPGTLIVCDAATGVIRGGILMQNATGTQKYYLSGSPALAVASAPGRTPVQVALLTGDDPSAVAGGNSGRLWITPAMLVVDTTGHGNWNQDPATLHVYDAFGVEIVNPALGTPHMLAPTWQRPFIKVTFTSWSLFANTYRPYNPATFDRCSISYVDINSVVQTISNIPFAVGYPVPLGGPHATTPWDSADTRGLDGAGPSVAGDVALVGTADVLVPAPPAAQATSVAGRVAAVSLNHPGIYANRVPASSQNLSETLWEFIGDMKATGTPWQAPAGMSYLSSFSYTPAASGDTAFMGATYGFAVMDATQEGVALPAGAPSAALYALRLRPGMSLVQANPNDPLRPGSIPYPADWIDHTTPAARMEPVAMLRVAPTGQGSADPNVSNRAVWLSTNAAAAGWVGSPESPPGTGIPMMGRLNVPNYSVDYENGQINLEPSVFSRYAGQPLHVQYYARDAVDPLNAGRAETMWVPDIARWKAFFPRTTAGAATYAYYISSSPVVAQGHVYVGVTAAAVVGAGQTESWVYAFREDYPEGTVIDASHPTRTATLLANTGAGATTLSVSSGTIFSLGDVAMIEEAGGSESQYLGRVLAVGANSITVTNALAQAKSAGSKVSAFGYEWRMMVGSTAAAPTSTTTVFAPAVSGDQIFVTTAYVNGSVVGLANPQTLIADDFRLVKVDQGENILWGAMATSEPDPASPASEWLHVYRSFARVSRARQLPGGNMLVCDTGHNRVVEMDRTGNVIWQYPDTDLANPLLPAAWRQATPLDLRLKQPTDAHRYTYTTPNTGNPAWETVYDAAGVYGAVGSYPARIDYYITLIADAGNYRIIEIVRPLVTCPALNLYAAYAPNLTRWTGVDTGVPYKQFATILAGAGTLWDTPARPLPVSLMYTTAERVGANPSYGVWSRNVMAAVANHPRITGSGEVVGLVQVAVNDTDPGAGYAPAVTYVLDADDPVPARRQFHYQATSSFVPRAGGQINVFAPRANTSDFLHIAQAEQVMADYSATGAYQPCTLVVDAQGVKLIDNALWDGAGAGLGFEFTQTSYAAEMGGLTLPGGKIDPYGYLTQVSFLPTAAQWLRTGRCLIASGVPQTYGLAAYDPATGGQAQVSGPTKSEVFEVNPGAAVGQRIVDLAGNYFIVPDPFASPGDVTYPDIAGRSFNLRQPLSVIRE